MLRKLPFLLPLVILLLAVATPLRSLAQKTIYVIGVNPPPNYPYTTIQSGIDAASNGDTVVVGLASYFENINFKGKAITVTGGHSGALPVIQGITAEPAVVFQNGETSSSVLSYFRIFNGGGGSESEPHGPYYGLPGAIYINGASPSILNNIITQSVCNGVYVQNGAPLIQGNEIETTGPNSGLPPCDGIGIYVTGNIPPGNTLIYSNLIHDNTEGGINSFAVPGGGGAGITVDAPAIIENNTIYNNNANYSPGGGIDIEAPDSVFVLQNLIYNNSAGCGGGGIALPSKSLTAGTIALIANNTIVDNMSGPVSSVDCALSDQIFSFVNVEQNAGPSVVIVNNILSGSSTDASVDCGEADTPDEAYQPIFDHNILYNAGGAFFGQYCVDVSSKYGNLTADPQFNSPSTHDYSLTSNSPAIDAGNTSALQLLYQLSGAQLPADFEGNPRVINSGISGKDYPTIDIGAYEYPDQPATAPPLPTTMVLTFAQGNGMPYSVTANVQSQSLSSPVPPVGQVSFFVDGVPLGSGEINASGIATLSGFPLTTGTHALSATYPGHGNFSPATAIINIVVINLIPTSVVLTDSYPGNGNPTVHTPITFKVQVTADDGTIPSPITLTDLSTHTLLATLDPDASGVAIFTTSTLAQGPHQIEAVYAGNAIYAYAADSLLVIVDGATTTLTLTCGTDTLPPLGATIPLVATVTSPDGTPTGTVDFRLGGTDLGQSPLVNSIASSSAVTIAGSNLFIASYASQNGFGSSSATCQVDVITLILSVSSSANPASAYSPVTYTASLTGTPIPAGTYTLNIGSNPPVTMTASADGSSATYTTPGLAQGTYAVKATFTPANNSTLYVAFLLPQQVVTAPTGDFTLTGPSSLTTRTETSVTGTVNLTSIDSFQGTVALTCNLPLPTTYTCTISPTSIPLAIGGTGSATVTLSPTLKLAANPSASRILFASLFPLTLISLAGFFRRRKLSSLLPLAVLAILAASTTACGNDIAYPTTHPGAYPFTITATGATKGASAPTTHTLNITLNITP